MSSIIFFVLFFIGLLLLPRIWRLKFAVWSSIFQIYTVPVLGFYPSLALLSQASLAPALLSKRILLQIPIIFLIALMMMQMISLAWSPDIHLGLSTILFEAPFLILYITAFSIASLDPEKLYKLIKVYAIFSLAPLAMIIFFRLYYSLNLEYLRTPMARFFINPNTLLWYFAQKSQTPFGMLTGLIIDPSVGGWTQDFPNIFIQPQMELSSQLFKLMFEHSTIWTDTSFHLLNFDFGGWTNKPNGFFINPNVGAGYLGICSLLFFGIGTYFRATWIKIIALLHWLAIFLTLSVAAISLAISIPFFLSLFLSIQKKWHYLLKNKKTLSCSLILILLISILILFNKKLLLNLLINKIDSRFILLHAASNLAPGHLFKGLGFGGWEPAYEHYRQSFPNPLLGPDLPPHNLFVQLWSQSGILAVLLGIGFIISLLYSCWQAYRSAITNKEKFLVLCIISAFMWVFLQGMAENWGIIGEMHIQPILAVMYGLMMGLYYRA